MAEERTGLHQRIESGEPILVTETSPPLGVDPAPVLVVAKRYARKVHALGVSDNRDRVGMSALVAASFPMTIAALAASLVSSHTWLILVIASWNSVADLTVLSFALWLWHLPCL